MGTKVYLADNKPLVIGSLSKLVLLRQSLEDSAYEAVLLEQNLEVALVRATLLPGQKKKKL